MKKIALLRSNPKDAAFERIAHALASEYEVECYLWDRSGDYASPNSHFRIAYRKFSLRAGYHSLSTLFFLVLYNAWLAFKLLFARFDALHAIDLDTGLIGLWISKVRRKPFVYHCLDPYAFALPPTWPKTLGFFARKLENHVVSHSDVFIITDLLRMPQHEGSRPKRVIEFANVPHQDMPENSKAGQSIFIAGYIGSLIAGRNLRTIIEAMGELADRDIKLVLGGFGPMEDDLKNCCRQYTNVEFIGWVPYQQVLEKELSFDVMLHITNKENPAQRWVSPNKLFESMAMGKPIITGEGTLAAERVTRIGNGSIVPYGNKEALQKAILDLKANPGTRRRMGDKGREEFKRNWTYEIMAERLSVAYLELFKNCAQSRFFS